MTAKPRIALIHATPAAIAPAVTALAADFPDAEPWNLLDDKLLGDADAAGGLTGRLRQRMQRLIDHAVAEADGVLLTCSLYGPVALATQTPIPVLAPDQAAFDELAERGYASVLVVASFESALRDSVERLTEFLGGRDGSADDAASEDSTAAVGNDIPPRAAASTAMSNDVPARPTTSTAVGDTSTHLATNSAPSTAISSDVPPPAITNTAVGNDVPAHSAGVAVRGAVAAGAFDAAKSGDEERLAASIIDTVQGTQADAIFLAQYSLAPVAERVSAAAGIPVVTGPSCAAVALRKCIAGA